MDALPKTQCAVQLVGPGELRLNREKPVPVPGPHEVLLKVEACGLCFSDLKLLKQFSAHARKSAVIAGMSPDILDGVQSYVPGVKPGVPGHEVAARIVAVGTAVTRHRVGERILVQTDYRDLPTAHSNAAFGYNFEGGLQEYTIVDERVAVDPQGQRFLIPVSENKSASAVALVEPWACVENSYASHERCGIKAGGRLLVAGFPRDLSFRLATLPFDAGGRPAEIRTTTVSAAAGLPDEYFDDILYFGAEREVIENLNDKLAPGGIFNIILDGKPIGEKVSVGVGRVHYGMTRWIGTMGSDPADSYRNIPAITEIRPGDSIVVIGAGGPMGQMHVIRDLSSGLPGISITGTDVDAARLKSLEEKTSALAASRGMALRLVDTSREPRGGKYSYWALMAPVAALVAEAIEGSLPGALINIFAGIPAPTKQHIDLDAYIANRVYMFGTSGSVIEDMRVVLRKVEADQLDTNASLDAVAGMAGAVDGIKAIENRTLAGKIVVYPQLHDVPLIPLADMRGHYPTVAALLKDGVWNREAEAEFLRAAANG